MCPKRGYKLNIAIVFLCGAILILSSYINTMNSPPVLDDYHSFVRNSSSHLTAIDTENIERLARSKFGLFRFVPMLTLGWDFYWGKGSLAAFHVTNIVVHICCWIACFLMVWQLDSIARNKNTDKAHLSIIFPAAVSSIWALHPVQTSAVTYLVQRMASLQALFYILSVAFFVWGRSALQSVKKVEAAELWIFCAICSLGAFFSKENSAILPLTLIIVEIWFFQLDLPQRLWRKCAFNLRELKGLLLCAVLLLAMGWISVTVIDHFDRGYNGRHFTMAERLLTETRIVMHYFFAILVPNTGVLSLEHDVKLSTSLLSPPTTLFSIIALSALLYFSLVRRRRYPLITFGVLWFFLNLAIESTIVPLELIFDHRMYLPSVGLILAAVEAVKLLAGRIVFSYSPQQRLKLAWSGLAIVCSVLSLVTFYRNEDWRDIITINRDAVEKAPKNPRAHANYSVALSRVGRFEEALGEAYKAIELGRQGLEEHIVATTSVVTVYMQQELWEKAIQEGERLLGEKPQKFDAMSLPILYLKLAECHRMTGNYSAAYRYVERTLELTQRYGQLAEDKRWVYVVLDSLFKDLEKNPMDLDGDGLPEPGLGRSEEWIARKLYELGDHEGALRYARMVPESQETQEVVRRIALFRERTGTQSAQWSFAGKYLQSPWGMTEVCLGVAYAIRKSDALQWMRPLGETILNMAQRRQPANPDVHLLKGWYAFESDNIQEALSSVRVALELSPQYAKAWIALGFFEQRAGNLENSLAAFQHTLELYPGYPKRQVLKELMAQLETQLLAGPPGGTQHTAQAGLL